MPKRFGPRLPEVEARAIGGYPNAMVAIFQDAADIVGCQGSLTMALVLVPDESPPQRIHKIEPSCGGNPDPVLTIFQDTCHTVVAKTAIVARIMFIKRKMQGSQVHFIQALVFRSDPQIATFVSKQSRYKIIGHAVLPVIRRVMDESRLFPVKPVQASTPGADPKISIGVQFKGLDMIVRDAGWIFGIIAKDRKIVTVIPVKSILRTK